MLPREAHWFARQIAELPAADIFPMLDVGSQREDVRRAVQPWVDRDLFDPFKRRGHVVRHLDLEAGPGVDLVGDLADPVFRAGLSALGFRSVVCCNLLEHVPDRTEIARALAALVPAGGYLFVSVPNRYPYHPDPIDTLFRPGPAELAALFPGTRVRRQAVLRCGTLAGYVLARLAHSPAAFIREVAGGGRRPRTHAPPEPRPSRLRFLPWLVRPFKVTCLVLQKEPSTADRAAAGG
jgi:hypothetical protein